MCLQLSVESLSEQLHAASNPAQLEHQAGSSKLDHAVSLLLKQSEQGQLPGNFLGRLQSLAVVRSPEEGPAVEAVLRELCNLVRKANVVLSVPDM